MSPNVFIRGCGRLLIRNAFAMCLFRSGGPQRQLGGSRKQLGGPRGNWEGLRGSWEPGRPSEAAESPGVSREAMRGDSLNLFQLFEIRQLNSFLSFSIIPY